ncbi:MAG: 30S ribosomal protein S6 [bacterium]|nr:30S ribosomal protein S6 [bacterium]
MRNAGALAEELTVYELGFLILPSISENKLSDVTNAIRKVIKSEGGIEIDAEEPFKEALAYSMSKTIGASHYVVNDAYMGWIKFESDRAKVSAIKANIEKVEEILRFLLIKAPRETTFTFAKARAVIEDKEALAPSSDEEAVVK